MRIQHNIMAMNAYRNYNINTSALSKNLEKLSSGYKINRAGDDAAGLAISEKMRAQITGLNAATKNVKDGISLVKTAEGAMQEIQDMLNRMDYLATQSANGTYQDEVDREALQDEVDALRTEINRIAESANFNGIKLLDGSLDAGTYTGKIQGQVIEGNPLIQAGDATDPFTEVGNKTVLKKPAAEAAKTSITVNLHDVAINDAQNGDEITLKIGANTPIALKLTVDATGTAADKITAADAADTTKLAAKFKDLFADAAGANGKIDGQAFNATLSASGTEITFEQAALPNNDTEVVNCALTAEVTYTGGNAAAGGGGGTPTPAVKAKYSFDLSGASSQPDLDTKTIDGVAISWNTDVDTSLNNFVTAYNAATGKDYVASYDAGTKKITLEAKVAGAVGGTTAGAPANSPTTDISLATPAQKAIYSFEITAASGFSNGDTITVGGQNISIKDDGSGDITSTDAADAAQLAAVIAGKLQGAGNTDYDISANGNKIVYTAKNGGEVNAGNTGAGAAPTAAPTAPTTSVGGATLTFGTMATDQAGADAGAPTTVSATQETAGADAGTGGGGTTTAAGKGTGTWNVSTTKNVQGAPDSAGQLASTKIKLDSQFVTDGGKLTIGKNTYVFKVGDESKVTAGDGETLIDLKNVDPTDTEAVIKAAGIALSNKDGQVFDLGYDQASKYLSIHEHEGQSEYDSELRTHDGFQKLISAQTATKTVTDDRSGSGKPLTLQIGDTSDSFNQMEVNVGDMHVEKMGTVGGKQISDISVAHQDEAAEAVQVIKDAINYVSSVRGKLGATQNRLEHTQNNLSVMAENIQDAESTIRDTDVAEEMMSYVKNNILVQSAQAMLAQANQVPQGVLQLLG